MAGLRVQVYVLSEQVAGRLTAVRWGTLRIEALSRIFGRRRWDEVVFWALDLEMSGLHTGADRILSIGMVPIRQGVIRYGERFYSLVRPPDVNGLSSEGLRATISCRPR